MVAISPINAEQRERLLAQKEGHFHDFKAKEIAPSKLHKHISAFANAAGGDLYIGVAEETRADGMKAHNWSGFPSPEAANGHLQAFHSAFPLDAFFVPEFLVCPEAGDGTFVLHVQIQKTRTVCRTPDDAVYLRKGAQSIPVKEQTQIDRLQLDKGVTSFENEPVNAPKDLVTNSLAIIEFLVSVIPSAEPESWLRKQLLFHADLPTVASLLLFADEPQVALPKRSAIKIYRYRTTDDEGTRETLTFDPLSVEGNLYAQIASAVKRTADLVEGVQIMGPYGLEPIQYPVEALHEIITNAVLHRDYSIPSDIHIRIFDNRIEVESPGRLPGHVTAANILSEQFARNGKLVRLINKFPNPPNKDVGEGLNTAFQAMRALRLKDPIIEDRESSLLVKIVHERLASPEEAILTYLRQHSQITNSIARRITGIASENKVKEVFYRLRDAGKMERVPDLKGSLSAWRMRDAEAVGEDPSGPDDET
jgi:ATP-dependent DNA helicase RecG